MLKRRETQLAWQKDFAMKTNHDQGVLFSKITGYSCFEGICLIKKPYRFYLLLTSSIFQLIEASNQRNSARRARLSFCSCLAAPWVCMPPAPYACSAAQLHAILKGHPCQMCMYVREDKNRSSTGDLPFPFYASD
jgi:hypothetical protein